MNSLLEQNLISTKDASALSGYNPDYLARLCRSGKISGTRVGRAWLVSQESLEAFVKEQGVKKQELRSTLSEIRGKEYHAPRPDNTTPRSSVTFDNTVKNVSATPSSLSNYTPFQKRALAVLASLVVLVVGIYGSQSKVLAEIGTTSLATAVTAANGFDDIIADGIQSADDQAVQEYEVQPTTTHQEILVASNQSVSSSKQFAEVLAPLLFTRSTQTRNSLPRTLKATSSLSSIAAISVPHENLFESVGDAALSLGVAIRDTGVALPRTLALNEVGLAVGFSQFSDSILQTYSNGVYAYVDDAPIVPAFITQHVYDAGERIADVASVVPEIAGDTSNAALADWFNGTRATATSIASSEIALSTSITTPIVSTEQNGVTTVRNAAYQHVVAANQTLAEAPSVASYVQSAGENTVLGMIGSVATDTDKVPGALAETSGSLATAIVPTPASAFGEQLALFTYHALNGIVSIVSGELALITGTNNSTTNKHLAVEPNMYVIPATTAAPVGYTLPSSANANIAVATNENSNSQAASNGSQIINNYYSNPVAVSGASQQYVDDSIANLRNLMFEQVDSALQNISRNPSSGGGTTIINNNSGGTNLDSSSDISIDGITANTGTFGTLDVTGNSTLNGLTAATSTFNGDVYINGTLHVTNIAGFVGGGSGTSVAGFFDATSSTATSTFAGNVSVAGNTALATTTISSLVATNASTTNLFSEAAIFGNSTSTNAFDQFLTAEQATTTDFFATLAHATTGIFDNLIATIANITNLTTTNSTSTNATSTNLFATNGSFTNLLATIANFASEVVGSLTATNAVITNSTTTNATSTNLFATNLSGTNANLTNATTTNLKTTNFVATNASSTNGYISQLTSDNAFLTQATSSDFFASVANFGSLSIGNLNGILKATNGSVSTSLVNLATDITGILPVSNGGTGWSAIQTGAIPYGNGTGALATTSAGTNGQTLSLENGIPTWSATTTFSNGLTYSAGNVTNTGVLSLVQGSGTPQSGAITLATSSLIANGQTQGVTITNSGTTFTFTPTLSGTLAVSGGGTGSTTLTGLLKGNGTGSLLSAIAGTDYQAPITLTTTGTSGAATFNGTTLNIPQYSGTTYTGTYPIQVSGSTISLAFGTTTANTWSVLQTFNGGASTTNFTASGNANVGSLTVGSLNGVLHATAGVISASAVNLASDITGILSVGNGGTGWAAIQSGAIPYGNGTGAFATTTSGANGQTLALANGVPTWVATTTFSSGLTYAAGNVTNTGVLSVTQNGGGTAQVGSITLATSSQTVFGITYANKITNTAGTFTFTPNISGNLTVGGGGTGSTTLTGLLKGNGTGGILTAVAGTDYQTPITLTTTGTSGAATFNGTTLNIPQYSGTTYTGTYPVQVSGSTISLAFGTTTSNTWGGLQTFTNTPILGTLTGLIGSNNGALYQLATSTPTLSLGISYSGTLGSFVGGTGGAFSIATSSLYTGTTGQFPYFSGTNTITATSTIFIAPNGNVGIGSTTPFANLSVTGTPSSANPAFAIRQGASQTGDLFDVYDSGGNNLVAINQFGNLRGPSNTLQWGGAQFTAPFNNNVPLLVAGASSGQTGDLFDIEQNEISGIVNDVVNNKGQFGLGTSTTPWLLDVATSSTGAFFHNGQFAITDSQAATNLKHIVFSNENGNLYISPATDLFATSTPSFTILSGGNVGIGTSSPGTLLSIGGVANFSAATSTLYGTGGINLANGGCFAVGGNCLTVGSFGGTLAVANGGTGSTTLGGILVGNGTGSVTSLIVGSGLVYSGGTLSTSGAGITAIGPTGQTQTGGTQILATTTSSFNGLTLGTTITASGNTINFQPTLSGLLGLGGGGTGTTTGGVTNGVEFFNGSNLTNNNGFIYNGSNVGIGTTTPTGLLSISDTPANVSTFPFFISSSTAAFATSTLLSVSNAGALTANSNINSVNGTVGAGTSPNSNSLPLYAVKTAVGDIAAYVQNNDGATNDSASLILDTRTTAGDTSVGGIVRAIRTNATNAGDNDLAFFNSQGTAMNENFVLKANRTAGLGTTTPGGEFAIQAIAGVNYPGNSLFTIASSTSSATSTFINVLNTGNVGIGTSSPYALLSIGNTNGIGFTTATSTFNTTGGLNLSAGCYAINGTCLATGVSSVTNSDSSLTVSPTAGNVVVSLNTSHANTFTALQQFNGGASTTQLSAGIASFGVTATSTFSANGSLVLAQALGQGSGGTGFSSYSPGAILYADGSGNLQQLPIGSNGQVLKIAAGLPGWGVDLTTGSGGGGDGVFGTTTSGVIYPLNTSNPVVIGSNATSTANSIFEVSGQQYISSKLGIATTSPSQTLSVGGNAYFTGGLGVGLVNSVAGTLQTSGNATIGGTLSIGSLNGFLKATAGVVSASAINLTSDITGILPVVNGGTGWGAVQSGTLLYGNGTGALATTTAGTNGQVLAFLNGVPSWTASTTYSSGLTYSAGNVTNTGLLSLQQNGGGIAQTGAIIFATSSQTTNGLTVGTNITNTGGTFTFTPTISGTLGVGGGGTGLASTPTYGQLLVGNGSGYTLTATSSLGLLTTNVAEGSNLYFTNARADARINATSTIGTLLSAPNLGTVSTSLNGFLKATAGVLSTSLVDLTSNVTNTLPVGNGGTGTTSFTTNGVVYGNGTSAVQSTAQGGLGSVLVANGGAPSFSSAITVGTSVTTGVVNATTSIQLGGANINTKGTLSDVAYLDANNNFTGTTTLTNATSTNFFTTGFGLGANYFSSLVGNGLTDTNGVLSVATSSIGSGFFEQGGNSFGTTATLGTTDSNPLSFITGNVARMIIDTSGNVGIGTTSPAAKFAVNGNGFFGAITATSSINAASLITTGNANVNSLTIGSLTGVLQATAGVVSTAAVNLASEVTGVLPVTNGGTGWGAVQSGTLLYGNGTGALATTTAGTNGQVLAFLNGVPSWTASTTYSSGLTYSAGNVTNTGVLSVTQNGGGTAQAGAITLATSSQTLNGITYADKITNVAGTFTFTPNVSGTLTVGGGGTGDTTLASGQLVYGAGTGALQSVATGTVTNGTGISVTGGQSIIGSGLTITNTGVTGIAGTAGQINTTGSTGSVTLSLPSQLALQNASATNLSANTLAVGATGTTTISATGALNTPSLTIGSLTGVLHAVAGVISASAVNLATDITGTLGVGNGGTGWSSIQSGAVLYGNGSGSLSTTTAAANGQVLAFLNGIPTWQATTTFSSGLAFSGGNVTNTGLLSLQQNGGGSPQVGAIALATSSQTLNGITYADKITNVAGTFTFTPNVSGVLNVAGGGTGISSVGDGQLLFGGVGGGASNLVALATSTGGSILETSFTTGRPTWVATSTLGFITSAIQNLGPAGQLQNGSTVTIASSTSSFNGLTVANTIVGSGNTLTFTPSLSGNLTVAGGGTGATSFTSGQLLYGNGTGALQSVATGTITNGGGISVTGGQSIIGSGLTITNTGLLSLQQNGGGIAQTGAITLATSSQTLNGITYADKITNSGTTFTFTPNISGTLNVAGGGTGLTAVGDGQIIFGGVGGGAANLVTLATSTGGSILETSFTTGRPTWVATSTLGFLTTAIQNLGPAGQLQNGSTVTIASSTSSFNGLTIGNTITGAGNTLTFQPTITGTLSVAGGGTGDTSFTSGQLVYGSGTGNLQSVATSSASCSSGISCTAFTVIGSVSPAFTNTGVLSIGGTPNQIVASASTGAVTLSIPSQFNIQNASTTNLSANTVAFGGTGTTTVSSTGALTTPSLTIGTLSGLLYGNSGAATVATINSPLAFVGGALGIQQGSASQPGYISAADWTTFNNKISSTSLSAVYPLAYNSTTGVFSSAFGTTSSNIWTGLQTFSGGASTTNLSANTLAVGATGTTTISSSGVLNTPSLVAVGNANVGSLTVGSLSGFLFANNGVVGTSLINLNSDVFSTLPIANGGTGINTQTTNGVNYFDGSEITSGTNLTYDGTTFSVNNGAINVDQYSQYEQDGFSVLYASSTNDDLSLGQGIATAFQSNSGITNNIGIGANFLGGYTSTSNNVSIGTSAGGVGGGDDIAIGTQALFGTGGTENIALGTSAEQGNNSATGNIALGAFALFADGAGATGTFGNIGIGVNTLGSADASQAVGIGDSVARYNDTASQITAIGANAAIGGSGSYSNQGGVYLGYQSGFEANNNSDYNTLLGYQAGYDVSTGFDNILIGAETNTGGNNITTGGNNIALGYGAVFPSSTANNQLNIANTIFGTITATSSSTSVPSKASLAADLIGIGTTTPHSMLTIGGNASIGTDYDIAAPTNGLLVEGNVGIGTTSPGTLLSIGNTGGINFTAATSTFNTTGGINIKNGCYAVNGTCLTQGLTTAVTSIGPAGQLQSGPAVTLATTSSSGTGLTIADTITGSGNTLTFAPTLSGFLNVGNGGTGTSTGGVTNGVEYYNGSTLTNGNFFSDTGTNVGIGATTTPYGLLSIDGTTAGASIATPDLVVKGVGSQTANEIEARSSAGVLQWSIGFNGAMTAAVASTFSAGARATGAASSGLFAGDFIANGLAGDTGFGVGEAANATGNAFSARTSTGNWQFALNDTTGNFSIGTNTAAAVLHIQAPESGANVSGYGSQTPLFDVSTTTSASYATSTLFNIQANGNVGIGVTAPISQLANTATNQLDSAGNGSNLANGLTFRANGAGYAASFTNAASASVSNGVLIDSGDTSGNSRLLDVEAAGVSKLLVSSNGNVGIGTTTPGTLLSILNIANFGTATSSFYGTGGLNIAAGCYAVNGTCLTQGLTSAVTSIGPTGQLQTGPAVTFATTSTAFNGLTASTTITGSGNTLTFSNTLSGILGIGGGGTGTSTGGVTNGVEYYNGSIHTNNANFTYNGTSLSVGHGNINVDQYSSYNQNGGVLLYASSTNQSVAVGVGQSSLFESSSTILNNTALGYDALTTLGTGDNANVAVGDFAMEFAGGSANVAVGDSALFLGGGTGGSNVAIGSNSQHSNNGGTGNISIGSYSLYSVANSGATGSYNSAVGNAALQDAVSNNAVGFGNQAAEFNHAATNTTAIGTNAAFGNFSNYTNQGGTYLGYQSGFDAGTNSDYNTFLGYQAGFVDTTGSDNIFIGPQVENTSGTGYISTGGNNIGLGYNTLFPSATANNQLNIGNFIFGTLPATTSASTFGLPTTGSLGIGSSSPYATLSINANRGSTNTTLFAIGSSTQSATTTLFNILNTGNVGIGTTSPGTLLSIGNTGGINFTAATSTFNTTGGLNISGGCYAVNGTCITAGGGSGITAIGPAGQTQTGSTIAFASTTSATTGLTIGTTITGAGNTLTFAPTLSGILNVANGGTGLASLPVNQLLYGGAGGTTVAGIGTSTPTLGLGLSYSGTLGGFVGGTSGSLTVATSSLYTGTTGQLPYFNGTNQLAGTSTIFIASNGNVGIGSTTPTDTLSITENAAPASFNGAGITIQNVNTSNASAATISAVNDVGNSVSLQELGSNFFGGGNKGVLVTTATDFDFLTDGALASGGTHAINFSTGGFSDGPSITILGGNPGNVGIGSSTPGTLLSVGTTNGINFSTATSTFSSTGGINIKNGCFAVNGVCITAGGGGAVSSVSNSDGSLTISPTTGAVVSSLNPAHSNIFTALQTFNGNASTTEISAATAFFNAFFATSTTATSSIASNLTIGAANTNYFTNAPLVITTNVNSFGQEVLQNLSNGSTASTDFILENDKGTNGSYYGDLGINSSGNSDSSYTGFGANDTYLYSNDANLDLAAATSTGKINFLTGGTLATNIHMTIASNGNVGIGTTSPAFNFSVVGQEHIKETTDTANALAIENSVGSTTFEADTLDNSTAIFSVSTSSGATYFTVGASGNIGIGTTSPYALLSIGNTNGIGLTTATSTFNTTGGINLSAGCFAVNGTCISGGGSGSGTVNTGTTGQTAYYAAGGTALTATSTIFIAPNGNVGIGSTTPFANLSVTGTPSSANPAFAIRQGASQTGDLFDVYDSGGNKLVDISQFGNFLVNANVTAGAGVLGGVSASTPPLQLLSIFGGGQTSNILTIAQNSAGTFDVVNNIGQFGLGTSTTPWLLDVATSSTGAFFHNGQFAITDSQAATNLKHIVFSNENGNLYISPATDLFATSTPSFTILSGGNVGIGTSSPGTLLSIGGVANFSAATSTLYGTGGINLLNGGCFAVNGTCIGNTSANPASPGGSTNDVQFNAGSGLFGADTGLFDYNTATHSLSLGTSTSVTGAALDVGGPHGSFALTDNSAGTNLKNWLFTSEGGNLYIGTTTDLYATSTPAALTFLNNGNIGIGTSSPWARLSIGSSTTVGGGPEFAIQSNATTSFVVFDNGKVGIGTSTENSMVASSSAVLLIVGSNKVPANVDEAAFAGAGTVCYVKSGTGISCSSDSRLKQNINPLAGDYQDLMQLQPVTYNWKTEATGTPVHTGFIAQQVLPIFPDLVSMGSDGYYTLNYANFTPYIVSAIQQQNNVLNIANALNATSTLVTNYQGTSTPAITVDPAGNVGIGSQTIASKLNVSGGVTGASFTVSGAAPALTSTFNGFGLGSTTVSSVLTSDGTSVDLYKLATFTLSNVQILAAQTSSLTTQTATLTNQVSDLETRVSALEAAATAGLANASSTPSSDLLSATTTQLASALESVGVLLQNGIAQFNTLVVRDLVFSKDTDGTSAAGSGTVLAGNTVVQITNDHMLPTSQVSITPTSAITGNWYVSQKTNGSFTVTISQTQSSDFTFDYLIVETQGQIATTTPTGYAGSAFSWINALFGNSTTTTTPPPTTPSTTPTTPSVPVTASTTSANGITVTLTGGVAISLNQGDLWIDPGATATDASSTDISSSITVSGTVDTATPGIYTLTYTATDSAGNTGSASRVVTVSTGVSAGGDSSTSSSTSTPSDSGSGSSSTPSVPPPSTPATPPASSDSSSSSTGSDASSGSTDTSSDSSDSGSSSSSAPAAPSTPPSTGP